MPTVNVHRSNDNYADIDQLPLKRDWMDATFEKHAYHCFPVSLANRLGWGISFPVDISFIWDGINDSSPDHIKIISGERYVHPNRGNRTISFNTGLTMSSKNNITLLTSPVPNQFIEGAQCLTTLISTSALPYDFPIAWMVTTPNIEITIPANTPVAAVLPISIKDVEKYEMSIANEPFNNTAEFLDWSQKRGEAIDKKISSGEWTNFYRDAVDHLGNPYGEHESKKITLKTIKE
jgi:hypothetical protein